MDSSAPTLEGISVSTTTTTRQQTTHPRRLSPEQDMLRWEIILMLRCTRDYHSPCRTCVRCPTQAKTNIRWGFMFMLNDKPDTQVGHRRTWSHPLSLPVDKRAQTNSTLPFFFSSLFSRCSFVKVPSSFFFFFAALWIDAIKGNWISLFMMCRRKIIRLTWIGFPCERYTYSVIYPHHVVKALWSNHNSNIFFFF